MVVWCKDYMVDASKPVKLFLSNRQRCVVWHWWKITPFLLINSGRFSCIALIAITVDSRDQNQIFYRQQLIVNDFLPFPPDTTSFSLTSIRILQLFVLSHLASITIFFKHYCHPLFIAFINLFRNGSIFFQQ